MYDVPCDYSQFHSTEAVPDKLEGKDVIVIRVPRAERTSRPVYVGSDPRTGTYRRNFEGDYHCSIDEVSLMIRDSALVTDDNKLLTDLDVSVFCPDTVKSYRNIFQLIRQNHLWNKEDDAMFLRRIGAVREATVNMLANADFYGRRGVVVQKRADGFRFANPGSMRVSLTEAIQDSASDPRNGVMMKMLAMVKYGERAGSGLQGIFKTWQSVYHCAPKLEVTTSGGVDRTTLTLGFEGHQPDIEAMKLLYDNPDELIEVRDTSESKGESKDVAQNVAQTGVDVAQKGDNVPQNVALNGVDVAQNLDDCIIALIQETPNIKREDMARGLSVTKKTIERHMKNLKISWEGHPKTGHWLLPKKE